MSSEETPSIAVLRQTGRWYALPTQVRRQRLQEELTALLEELCVIRAGLDSAHIQLHTLGIDSLQAFEIESEWELRTAITFDIRDFLQHGTITDVIGIMLEHDRSAPTGDPQVQRPRDWTV